MNQHLLASIALSLCIGSAAANEVVMAFGERIPPFCFPESNSGIELEVIGEALALRGHVLKPKYYPFARVPHAFKLRQVDAAMTDLGENMTPFGGHYGAPAVIYDNVFITLATHKRQIVRPSDLNGLTVVSFQGALKRYPAWLQPVKQGGRYTELNDQALQVRTLDAGHYDVVLSDRHIFRYFSLQLKQQGINLQPVTVHPFVTPDPQNYRPVFPAFVNVVVA